MIFSDFDKIPLFNYGVILADPPWHFTLRGNNPAVPYKTMSIDEICDMKVGHLAAPDCALMLWGTSPMLPEVLKVMDAWGFTYKGKAFCWAKTCKLRKDWPADNVSTWHMGRGYSSRSNTEDCWIGVNGTPKRLDFGVRELLTDPVGKHSAKPEEVYRRASRLFGGPYMDLFSRQERVGWDQFGDEVLPLENNEINGSQLHA